MIKLEALGRMRCHQLDRIFMVFRSKRNGPARLAKVIEIFKELSRLSGLRNGRLLPFVAELHQRVNRRAAHELEFADQREQRRISLIARTLLPCTPHRIQHLLAAFYAGQHRYQQCVGITRNRLNRSLELIRIY